MNKKQLKNIDLLKNNPLVDNNFKIIVNKLTDKKTFQNSDGILIHKEFYFEVQPVIKTIKTPENRILIAQLSAAANKLFNWITFEVQTNQDFVLINIERCKKENNFKSNKTYYNALNELKAKCIICNSTVKHVYFINPRLFYCGNRTKMYPNNVQIYQPVKPAR